MGGIIGAIVKAVDNSPRHQERMENRHERQSERHERREDRHAERADRKGERRDNREIGMDVMTGRISPQEGCQLERGMHGIEAQQAMGGNPWALNGELGSLQGDIQGYQDGCPPPIPPGVQFSPWNNGMAMC